MNSSDVVHRKEGEGSGYYERWSAEARMPGLSRFFAMLSEDELRHAAALRALKSGSRVELEDSGTLDGARHILRDLSLKGVPLAQLNVDLAAYGRGMDFEAASVRLYGRLAREAVESWERELLLSIAAQDEVHFTLLETLRELLEPAGQGEGGLDAN